MNKYNIVGVIGDGTFGQVSKATNSSSTEHMIVAIKELKQKYTDWKKCLKMPEIQALMKLQHPNIVKLLEVIKENNKIYMVFEYLQRNVYQLMKETDLDLVQIRNIIFQTLQGMFHRDLKPENLLESQGTIKIADFGLAKNINDEHPFTDYVSTRWYRAPEIILCTEDYDYSIDIFAIGCIFAELILRKPLFPGNNESDQLIKILQILGTPDKSENPDFYRRIDKHNFKVPKFPKKNLKHLIKCSDPSAIDLLEQMLQLNPKERITAYEALQHEFFQVRLIKNVDNLIGTESMRSKNSLNDQSFSETTSRGRQNQSKSLDSNSRISDNEEEDDDPVNFYLRHARYKPGVDLYKLIKENSNFNQFNQYIFNKIIFQLIILKFSS